LVKTTRGSKDQVLIEAIVLVKFQKDFPDLMEQIAPILLDAQGVVMYRCAPIQKEALV
jgi:hypothetical protein